MLLAITFDDKNILHDTMKQFGPVAINKGENRDKRTVVSASQLADDTGCMICLFFGSAFQFGFLPSKPLNSCYTEANSQRIGYFPPMDVTDGSTTGFSSIYLSAVEPAS